MWSNFLWKYGPTSSGYVVRFPQDMWSDFLRKCGQTSYRNVLRFPQEMWSDDPDSAAEFFGLFRFSRIS